ncbi:MAG: deoxyuridine 5'-triphosphate nucleotidohydrolase [Oscillospiraceae bacterium]|nr:deoxyuridine 5'-triphosphate nucleotidohydrolase [Oscillospiraceae bacterium]MDO5149639.1 deoxyuridine 5'-triphosphate nucleotidohydrolase [Oscillospiraceae bacterium]
MKRIAEFQKVSREQFVRDWTDSFGDCSAEQAEKIYEGIKIPARATSGSAGYDFCTPVGFSLAPGETIKIPTGIRVKIEEGWMLGLYPRSGLGFKYRMQLNNTVGIIDSDYYYSDNEGHIMVKFTNASNTGLTINLNAGDAFSQGIFTEYGITFDDDATGVRNGGFGSTGR